MFRKFRFLRSNLKNWARMRVVRVACAVVALGGVAWGGYNAWTAWQNHYTPSCSWPVHVRGVATAQQSGLVQCYLRALAARDTAMLMRVADNIPPVRITKADLGYSADARSGLATVTFTPDPVDTTYVLLKIVYANGVQEHTGMINMVAMGGSPGWRMDIGTVIKNSEVVPTYDG
jgi:hypothetical protein